jgi:hypothetical protein
LIYQREREAENQMESAVIEEMQIDLPEEDGDDADNNCDEEMNEVDLENSEDLEV